MSRRVAFYRGAGLLAMVLLANSTLLDPTLAAKAPKQSAEKIYSVTMPKSYLPAAPANGTDDYRCFLLDPKVTEDSIIRSIQFIPQQKNYVHHAIIFRVTDSNLQEAISRDKDGTGWSCFGGSGLGGMLSTFVTSPWLSSWAPGRGIDVAPSGYGTPFKKGERFVLQVHYNLLAAQGGKTVTDQSTIVMKVIPSRGATIKQLRVELFPAPVELACPDGVTGPLCDRKAALADLGARTENASVWEAAGINLICGQNPINPTPSLTSTCERTVRTSYTIIAAGPHMHLLGRSLKLVLNPNTPNEQVILDVTNYDFDNQASKILAKPIKVNAGDVIRVQCTFDPTLRQKLPALKNLPPRYITWGEGSSDEMCLGVAAVAAD